MIVGSYFSPDFVSLTHLKGKKNLQKYLVCLSLLHPNIIYSLLAVDYLLCVYIY